MNIGWIEISKVKYGGITYNEQAQDALRASYAIERIFCGAKYAQAIRYLKLPETLWRLSLLKGEKDVWFRDFYSTLTLPFDRTKGRNVVVIHHIDSLAFSFPEKWILFLLEKLFFYRNLRKADAIVTISEYWKQYFLKRGYEHVYKIYPGVNISSFPVHGKEAKQFAQQHGLEGKPVIYLGNCQKAKGVVEAYEALQGIDAHFVTSGRRQVRIPVLNFDLSYREYLMLLKLCSVVLTMSKMKEGWCITAQEAMLCKTPVIGSGLGGMKELLEGGGQIVSEGFQNIKKEVEYVLSHPAEAKHMGETGYAFAQQFHEQRVRSDWVSFLQVMEKEWT